VAALGRRRASRIAQDPLRPSACQLHKRPAFLFWRVLPHPTGAASDGRVKPHLSPVPLHPRHTLSCSTHATICTRQAAAASAETSPQIESRPHHSQPRQHATVMAMAIVALAEHRSRTLLFDYLVLRNPVCTTLGATRKGTSHGVHRSMPRTSTSFVHGRVANHKHPLPVFGRLQVFAASASSFSKTMLAYRHRLFAFAYHASPVHVA
jgi:hypothetical protein